MLPKKIALLQALLDYKLERLLCEDHLGHEDVEFLGQQIERLSRLIERHHNIRHKEANVATNDKVRTWLTQAAVATRSVLEEWVPAEDVEKAKAQLISRIAAFGIDIDHLN